jgi:hypothetical protein
MQWETAYLHDWMASLLLTLSGVVCVASMVSFRFN